MDAHQIKYREKLAEHLIKQLTKRRMAASYPPPQPRPGMKSLP